MAMKDKWMFVALGYVLMLAALGFALDAGIAATVSFTHKPVSTPKWHSPGKSRNHSRSCNGDLSQNLGGQNMTSAVSEDVPVRTSMRQLSSHTDVKSIVAAFYDAPTGSIQYVVTDPNTRKCVVIDPVLDFDPRSGQREPHPPTGF
jgi:hypothetical protein